MLLSPQVTQQTVTLLQAVSRWSLAVAVPPVETSRCKVVLAAAVRSAFLVEPALPEAPAGQFLLPPVTADVVVPVALSPSAAVRPPLAAPAPSRSSPVLLLAAAVALCLLVWVLETVAVAARSLLLQEARQAASPRAVRCPWRLAVAALAVLCSSAPAQLPVVLAVVAM
jgi:hypothetical protein